MNAATGQTGEQPEIRYPESLPITARREELLQCIRANPVVIVAGETGSGKSTQIPKLCLEAGLAERGRIVCTQPRRVAALAISRRIAEEMKVQWGGYVGAKIRFNDKTARHTRIAVMTDGMLLSELQRDRLLRGVSAVVIDEAHERSLNIDFLLGYLKLLRARRPELKLIITSATIDTGRFSAAFDGAPVIEVSGRMYPVETVYAPLEESEEDADYIEGVVSAVGRIVEWNRPGDILVFLPGERDIREVREQLENSALSRCEILPLFGRLTGAEQDRIFSATQRRKIILATNIAETSITIPGIRYVVDSGLARISRYSAGTRTRRLPIEKVPQSSAEQRRGRAGRVSEGVCIRLYSEADYLARERFATPEILRSNLADVILRMLAYHIGDIETFPFLEPPPERAIRAGYQQLVELGALDSQHRLTELGRKMARLPVDPAVARMLLEAEREGCMREVLVIAAGLSIQDPRERPMDAIAEADQMHRKFRHPESDFLTLLGIWDAFHDQLETLPQRKVRKFCREHYLSYQRMREWRDIHAQLEGVLKDINHLRINSLPAEYDAIHRALLSGLLSGVGHRVEGNAYHIAQNRRVLLFPGSTLFQKGAPRKKPGARGAKPVQKPPKAKAPEWILSAEFVETRQVYARTAARIEAPWILRLGAHLLKTKYTEPRYDEKAERAVVRERTLLNGLEIRSRFTGLLKTDPAGAKALFIREALVEGRVQRPLPSMEHNNALRERLEERQTRMRAGGGWLVAENLYTHYAARIPELGSMAELRRWLAETHGGDERVLMATEADLQPAADGFDGAAFPDQLEQAGIKIVLDYAYKPGEPEDGATLKIPVTQFEKLNDGLLDWAVPGYIRERVEQQLRGLPKALRVKLMPIGELTEAILLRLRPGEGSLAAQISRQIHALRGVEVPVDIVEAAPVAEHLRPRLEIVDTAERVVASGRDWERVRAQYTAATRRDFAEGKGRERMEIWRAAQQRTERENLRDWDIADQPIALRLGDIAGLPLVAFPGLENKNGQVNLRLYPTEAAAAEATAGGYYQLCCHGHGRELAWMEKDCKKELQRVALSYGALLDIKTLTAHSMYLISRYLFECAEPLPLRRATWEATQRQAVERGRGIVQRHVDQLEAIAAAWQRVRARCKDAAHVEAELTALLGPRFLLQMDWQRLQHYPRYLKAIELRHERAQRDPARDRQRAAQIIPYITKLNNLRDIAVEARRALRWLIEEYKVQIFAQELGTAEKVSAKQLDRAFEAAAAQPKKTGGNSH